MTIATKFAAITLALSATSQALAAVASLDCSTTKVVITNGKSTRAVQELHFKVDDSTKTITFADGTPLRVIRFDDAEISAEHDDMRYATNRIDGTLTYAGSTVGNTTVITVGSGQCRNRA
jgi:hypothetical protein